VETVNCLSSLVNCLCVTPKKPNKIDFDLKLPFFMVQTKFYISILHYYIINTTFSKYLFIIMKLIQLNDINWIGTIELELNYKNKN